MLHEMLFIWRGFAVVCSVCSIQAFSFAVTAAIMVAATSMRVGSGQQKAWQGALAETLARYNTMEGTALQARFRKVATAALPAESSWPPSDPEDFSEGVMLCPHCWERPVRDGVPPTGLCEECYHVLVVGDWQEF